MTVKMQQRRGTAAQWTSANPVLAAGEIGVETDTLRAKIGDGSTAWASLTYFTLENGSVGTTKLADSAVTSGKIADGAVTSGKILIGAATFGSGTGTPEGVVTAEPGSTWLQTDATTDVKGWIRWVKATGTGNTGWVAGPEADTGTRDVSGLLESGATGLLYVRRIGGLVMLKSFDLDSTVNGMWTVPDGFRPVRAGDNTTWAIAMNDGTAGSVSYGQAGLNKIDMNAALRSHAGMCLAWSWMTDNAWPSSLPGTAL